MKYLEKIIEMLPVLCDCVSGYSKDECYGLKCIDCPFFSGNIDDIVKGLREKNEVKNESWESLGEFFSAVADATKNSNKPFDSRLRLNDQEYKKNESRNSKKS